MARRAVLRFMPIEYAYQKEYGIMPDYDYTNRLKAGESREKVSALIDSRMKKVWEKMKAENEKQNREWQDVPTVECPF